MEGHAKISTFEAMKLDPVTKPIYKKMVDASGNPVTCDVSGFPISQRSRRHGEGW